MAGPLQGPAAGSMDRTPYAAGRGAAAAGGKIRSARHHYNSNPAHQQPGGGGARRGPYDRPPNQAARPPRRGAWIGSRILSGASSILSSLFGRDEEDSLPMLPAPPTSSPPLPPPPPAALLRYEENVANHDINFGGSGDQIEDLLKDRVFTREQCDRFIKVLQSKLVPNIPNGIVSDRDQRYPDDELERERERDGERDRSFQLAHRDMDHQDDAGSSPVDIAKAYMDNRLSPVPASAFPIRTLDYEAMRTQEEYRATPSRAARTPLSHIRIATPGHTPYVRLRPNNIRATPYPVERKRRVDDDVEYTGRRTKLKMTPSNGPPVSLLPSASNGGYAGNYSDRMKNLQRRRLEKRSKDKDDAVSDVPSQSSETARRILETLETLTPPKIKTLDEELAVVRRKRPKELSPSMMSEQARKTEQILPLPDAIRNPAPIHFAEEPSSSELPVGRSVELNENDTKGKAVTTFPEPSIAPLPVASEQTTKGFRMNAAMEESISDDEAQVVAAPAVAAPAVATTAATATLPEAKPAQLFGSLGSATVSKPASPPSATPAAETKNIFAFSSAPVPEKKASFELLNAQSTSVLFATGLPVTSTATEAKLPQLFGSTPASTVTAAVTPVAVESKTAFAISSAPVVEKYILGEPDPFETTATTATAQASIFTAGSSNDNKPAFGFGGRIPESKSFAVSSTPSTENIPAAFEFATEVKSFTAPPAISKAVETKSTPLFGLSSSASETKPAAPPAMPAAESKAAAFAFSSAPVVEKKASFDFMNSHTQPSFGYNPAPAPAATSTAETKPAPIFGSSTAMESKPIAAPVPAAESKPAFSFTTPEKKFEFGTGTSSAPFSFASGTNTGGPIFGIPSSIPSPTPATSSPMGTGDMEQDMAEEPASTAPPSPFGSTTPTPAAQPFLFGGNTAAAPPPFGMPNFGGGTSPNFGSQSFGSQPSFGSGAAGNNSTPSPAPAAPSQPFVFGSPSPPPPVFGAATGGFGGQQTTAPSFGAFGSQPFAFGAAQQPGAAAAGAPPAPAAAPPVFGAQPGAAAPANPFGGFSGGFAVGAGNTEGETRTRKIFKAKRTGASKRGK